MLNKASNVILVINAGSSSIKFSLFHDESLELILNQVIDETFELEFMDAFLRNFIGKYILKAVGHRVVHGGSEFFQPVSIDKNVLVKLEQLIPLAPLHETHNINAIKMISKIYPEISQVACFDTAFHRTQARLATLFAIPKKLTAEGMIRYGFHGLSYEYIASILPHKIDTRQNKKIIVAHLGSGASICALYELKSLATSMGFTPLDGLMMGTRSGAIDPGLILYLLQEKKMTVFDATHMLYNASGLLGVSGISSDMRILLDSTKKEAREAIDLFCYRAAQEIAALSVILKGCDAIVFTGGIGENAPFVRKKICEWLSWMAVELDDFENDHNSELISSMQSKIMIAVIPTNEEYMIAKHTLHLMGPPPI